ncbi:MAG: Asp-tRNA(Asn)/Glu-tRNA(Gln) amidotransferase subunit GatC [Candidatus Paceibacterota bacterium]|jgi:aspartyl-tRNA(Asn)/glutamyl-tRNA(Gln) amidotransferase subunit C
MAIALTDVEHLAGLARIAVSDSEKEVLRHDLEEILEYISQIKEVAAEMPIPEAGELHNVMREDEGAHEAGIFTEDILSQAPAREGNLLSVKKIL